MTCFKFYKLMLQLENQTKNNGTLLTITVYTQEKLNSRSWLMGFVTFVRKAQNISAAFLYTYMYHQ